MLINRPPVLLNVENEGGTAPQPPAAPQKPAVRTAEGLTADQVQDHEGRLKKLEGGFLDFFRSKPPQPAADPGKGSAGAGPGAGSAPAPKSKGVGEIIADCCDPFGLFDDERPAPKAPEAPGVKQ